MDEERPKTCKNCMQPILVGSNDFVALSRFCNCVVHKAANDTCNGWNPESDLYTRRKHAVYFCWEHSCGVCYDGLLDDDIVVRYPHCSCRAHQECFQREDVCIRHQCRQCKLPLSIYRRVRLSCGCQIHHSCLDQVPYPFRWQHCPYNKFVMRKEDMEKIWGEPSLPLIAPRWLSWQNRVKLLVDKGEHKEHLIERGVKVDDLIAANYDLGDLRIQGFAWTDLTGRMGFDPKHMLMHPFSQYNKLGHMATGIVVEDTIDADHHPRMPDADDWVAWKITPLFFLQHGVPISQFYHLGFRAKHCYEHGMSIMDIKAQDCSAADWALIGIGETELREHWGFEAPDFVQLKMRQSGWGHVNTAQELTRPRPDNPPAYTPNILMQPLKNSSHALHQVYLNSKSL